MLLLLFKRVLYLFLLLLLAASRRTSGHDLLHSIVTEQSLELLKVLEVLLIREGRVVDDRLVIKLHQRVDDCASWFGRQLTLLQQNDRVKVVNVDTLGRRL